jgi:hypothetical protein
MMQHLSLSYGGVPSIRGLTLLVLTGILTACGGGGGNGNNNSEGSNRSDDGTSQVSAPQKSQSASQLFLLAGNVGGAGNADGAGISARFYGPTGVATDRAGNVYVADQANNTIRKITVAGVVTTLAGTAGASGRVDGIGSEARFDHPTGVATDSDGNVYVADRLTIRKITPAGVVTTLAGGTSVDVASSLPGESGFILTADCLPAPVDGLGSAARFLHPTGIATDRVGNVYVADAYSIRKVTPAGLVSTLAGVVSDGSCTFLGAIGSADGIGTAALFN